MARCYSQAALAAHRQRFQFACQLRNVISLELGIRGFRSVLIDVAREGDELLAAAMSLSPDTVLRRNPALVFTELDDTLLMLDPERGCYHELDPVAARIWTLLERGPSVAELRETLLSKYDVAPDQCERDLAAFLNQALERHLVEPDTAR